MSAAPSDPVVAPAEPAAAEPPSPATFGRFLIAEREKRGLSLDDLAHLTKVRRAILEALEHDNRKELPERVFVAGYVRSCALALNLPVDEVLRKFNAAWSDEAPSGPAPAAARPARKISLAWLPPTLAALAFVVAVLVAVNL